MIALARTLAIVLVLLSWGLSLYCLWLIPSTTAHVVESYDSSPSCIFVHTTDALTGQSRFDAVPGNLSSALQENIIDNQAFGYLPAPTGSIIIHLKSHSAFYLSSDPTFMLEYNSSLVFVTNEYVSCKQYLDFGSRLVLHCSLSDVVVTQFSDIMLNAVLRFIFNNSTRRLVLMITDMTFRLIMLCCEVSTTPTPVMLVRSIYLSCVRPLMRKHDYAVLKTFGKHTSSVILIIFKTICVALRHCWMLLHRENNVRLYVPQKCVGINTDIPKATKKQVGGGSKRNNFFQNQELIPYRFDKSTNIASAPNQKYMFEAYMIEAHAIARYAQQKDVLLCTCTLSFLSPRLTGIQLRSIARHHNIFIGTRRTVSEAASTVIQHQCNNCNKYISVFKQSKQYKPSQKRISKNTIKFRQRLTEAEKFVAKEQNTRSHKIARDIEKTKFPPSSPTKLLMQKIVQEI